MADSEHANQKYFERDCDDFDRMYTNPGSARDPVRRLVQRGLKNAGPRARFQAALALLPTSLEGLTVLEVGFGHGHCSLEMARDGARVIGIDYAAGMVALAEKNRARLSDAVGAACTFSQADALTYEPDEPIDLVLALGVIEYVARENAEEFLKRLASFSRRWLLVAFPMKNLLFYPLRRVWLRLFKDCYVTHFSPSELEDLCQSANSTPVASAVFSSYRLVLMEVGKSPSNPATA